MAGMIATWETVKCILEFARSFPDWLIVSKRQVHADFRGEKKRRRLTRIAAMGSDALCFGASFSIASFHGLYKRMRNYKLHILA